MDGETDPGGDKEAKQGGWERNRERRTYGTGQCNKACAERMFLRAEFKVKTSRYAKNKVLFSVPCVYARVNAFLSDSPSFPVLAHCPFRFVFPPPFFSHGKRR